mmetsp:Transcript_32394/g.75232  ORF Transcript_32394/g.75232 Transcript_32394/m.75232 type:complete len:168 (+) Transcript_32394:36-539(+)|eukprot:CAMPEP_0171110086 /NCGR_PEP_ID=MMETSP0766_2-20121228/71156_1 /TAXON_ID=439317 /ORGANISM="Gambierdiscus australes, Strain CAWD 149" /LENGTH=167 /DNA_ID=CAMNT_0011571917 /DNA_START=36 /DNA_END=539 /DNA_ORIENTATION=+
MSDAESGSDGAEAPPPQKTGAPRFKNDEELKAHEESLKKEALADESTIKRLEEVRQRREKARLERETAERAEAELAERHAAKAAEEEERRQKALTERPVLELPGPKDIKSALMKFQECASDDFQKKHGLKGAGGNKLSKIKAADFKKIFDDFQENATLEELHQYKGT